MLLVLVLLMKDYVGISALAATERQLEPARPPALRLEALDGLRGLAAFYVLFFHVGVTLKPLAATMSMPWRLLNRANEHGHDAVVAFIVLSGFVLMLPVVRAKDGRLKGEFREYIRRRALRILPPYYMALLIFPVLGLIWHLATIHGASPVKTDNPFLRNTSAAGVVSHILLLHNLYDFWAVQIDSPMWSVATEWQIYFLFPFLLLPLWRRYGGFSTIIAGYLVGMIPVLLLPHGTNFSVSSPWFLCNFAMGLVAAELSTSSRLPTLLRKPPVWGLLGFSLLIAIALVQATLPAVWQPLGLWHKDMAVGAAIALVLVYLARCQLTPGHDRARLLRFLGSRPFAKLGAFSYSLYLVHHPIIDFIDSLLRGHGSAATYSTLMYSICPAACLILAYLFHLAFERPEFGRRCERLLSALKSLAQPARTQSPQKIAA